jgi:hypothetical protein
MNVESSACVLPHVIDGQCWSGYRKFHASGFRSMHLDLVLCIWISI